MKKIIIVVFILIVAILSGIQIQKLNKESSDRITKIEKTIVNIEYLSSSDRQGALVKIKEVKDEFKDYLSDKEYQIYKTQLVQLELLSLNKEDNYPTNEEIACNNISGAWNTQCDFGFGGETDQVSCEDNGGFWSANCSITDIPKEQCKSSGFAYAEGYQSVAFAQTVDTSGSTSFERCIINPSFGTNNNTLDFMQEAENYNRLSNYQDVLDLFNQF